MNETTSAKVSCRVSAAILRFAETQKIALDVFCTGLPVERLRLEDPRSWVEVAVVRELWERLAAATGNHEIAADVGLSAVHQNVLGSVGTLLRLFGTMNRTVQKVGDLSRYFSNQIQLSPLRVGASSARLELTALGGAISYHHLNFVRGLIAGLPTLWDRPLAHVQIVRFQAGVADCSPLGGRVFRVQDDGRVFSFPASNPHGRRDEGRLADDGSFTVDGVVFGAEASIYQITWDQPQTGWWLPRVFAAGGSGGDDVDGLAEDLREMEAMYTKLEADSDDLKQVVASRTGELRQANETLAALNEKLERQHRLKSEFVADFSHELRTLITSIVGFADLLTSGIFGDLNERQADACGRISTNTRVLLRAVNDLLDLSKLQAGKMTVAYEEVTVRDLLEECVAIVAPLAEEKNLPVRVEVGPEVPPHIFSDRAKLKNVLVNLLGNAIKFTERGHVTVGVSTAGPGAVSFSVEDTGCGIDEFELPTLFEEFARVGRGLTAGRPGVGLQIAKKLIDLLQGSIAVGSQPGVGTEVSVTMPVRPAGAKNVPREADLDFLKPGRALRTVVIGDANAEDATFLRLSFEAVGLRAEHTVDGRDVLRLVRESDADLLVLDPLMAHRDGWQVLHDLRADPTLASLPVVLLSENVQPDLAEAYRAAAFFAKPYDREAFVGSCLRLLGLERDEEGGV